MFKKIGFVILVVLLVGMLTSSVFAASGSVTILGTWTGGEAEAFNKMVAPFEAETGIKVEFTGTRDLPTILTTQVEAGNPPDVSALPNPGQMIEFAKDNKLVDLSTFMDDESNPYICIGRRDACLVFLCVIASFDLSKRGNLGIQLGLLRRQSSSQWRKCEIRNYYPLFLYYILDTQYYLIF